jgi:hypothetical protein
MPIVKQDELVELGELQQRPEQRDPVNWEWLDIASAGLQKHNPLSNLVSRGFKPNFEPDPEYDPWDDIEGYDPDSFVDVESADETQWIKEGIDQERLNNQILDDSGWSGTVSEVAGGLTNPILLASAFIPGANATIPLRILSEAAIAGSAEVVSEVALQNLQETRTADQSFFNIAAAAVSAGVLGGAISAYSKSQVKEINQKIVDEIITPDIVPFQQSGGAASVVRTVEEMTPQHWGKVLSKAAKITDLGQVMTSQSALGRKLAMELAETPYVLAMNKQGIASEVAIETLLKRWDGPLAQVLEFQKSQFKAWKRETGGNYEEFRIEVGRAMRQEDLAGNGAVDAVAKKYRDTLYNPLLSKAQASKLLPEDFELLGAPSYFPRMYNIAKIKVHERQFTEFLAEQFRNNNPNLDATAALESAVKTRNHILSLDPREIPKSIVATSGALKGRTLDLPDSVLEPWLISDVESVSRLHLRGMSTEIEFSNKFDGKNIDDMIDQIYQEYSIKMGDKADINGKLAKERDKVVTYLRRMHGRLTGKVGEPVDPSLLGVRIMRGGRQFNLIRMLGGMTLSAIPDIARPVMINGFAPYMKNIAKIIMNPATFKKAAAENKRFGVGTEWVLDTRIKAYSELEDTLYVGSTKFERTLEKGASGFGKLILMTQWNTAAKQVTGVMSSDNILRNVINGKGKQDLAQLGIDVQMSKRILKEAGKYGDLDEALYRAGTERWSDKEAAITFESAVLKQVDTLIVTPGIGDKLSTISFSPDQEVMKSILQFKAFGLSATNRMLLSGMDPKSLRVFNFMLVSVALGAIAESAKLITSSRWDKRPKTAKEWAATAVDRSGVIGIYTEPVQMLSKVIGKETSRYAGRSLFETFLGPSFGTSGNIAKMGVQATQGIMGNKNFTKKDIHNIRKIAPYNNVFYFRQLVDEMENGIANALGAR